MLLATKVVLAGVGEVVVANQMLCDRQAAMQHRQPDDPMRAGDPVRDNRDRQEMLARQIVTRMQNPMA